MVAMGFNRRLPGESEEDFKIRRMREINEESGDTTISDGLSLDRGSAAYHELVAERAGFDEFERTQEALGKEDGFASEDAWHKEQGEQNAAYRDRQIAAQRSREGRRQSTMARKAMHEVWKSSAAGAIFDAAEDVLMDVPDDERVQKKAEKQMRRLPKQVEENIYDESCDYDDFLPGSRTLNKYC